MIQKTLIGTALCVAVTLLAAYAQEEEAPTAEERIALPTTAAEARARARLLYESTWRTLQVVHRDFFDDDDPHSIPSASLEEVFEQMADSYEVEMRWLIVETDIVNVDHQPQDEFEKAAVQALKQGHSSYEAISETRYRFAGPIRLASQCLKCHVQDRRDTQARTAGLVIAMPLDQP